MRGVAGLVFAFFSFAAMPLAAQARPGGAAQAPSTAVQGTIRGTIVSETGQPVPAAAVAIRSARDSALVGGALTTADGRFRVTGLAPGRYQLRVSQLGYKPLTVPPVTISATVREVELGRLGLMLAPVEVQGVEATAARAPMVAAADRNIYNVKAMPVAGTGTAVDVLRSVPELEVDQNGKVTMHGNQSVAIHINGRPAPIRGEALQTFLQQMPGNRIDKVEVIANPSAKYDPEGMGGIVNIALKDNADLGFSGTLTGTMSTQGQNGISPRVAYQKGRLTFFGGGTAMFITREQTAHDLRENLLTRPISYLDLTSANRTHARYGLLDGTAEYKLSKTFTAWASLNGYGYSQNSDADLAYLWLDSLQSATSRSTRTTDNDGDQFSPSTNIGLRRQIQQQRNEWSVELRQSSRGYDTDGRWLEQPLLLDGTLASPASLTVNTGNNDYSDWRLVADLTRPLGKTGRLEAGVQGTRRRDGSDNTMDLFSDASAASPATSTLTGYLQKEELASAYITLMQPFGKLSLQGGLRAERANTSFQVRRTGQSFDNDYNSVFPSGNAMLNLGKGRTVRLSYSKRMDRPSASILNPDIPSSDPLNRNVGNPYLKPQYTHSVRADLSWTRAAMTYRVGPYFQRTTNDWEQVKSVDTLGVSTVTVANLAAANAAGINGTVSVRQTGRIGGYANASLYSTHYSAAALGDNAFAGNHIAWSLSTNASIKLSKALDGQLMAQYMPPRDMPSGRMSGIFYTYGGFRQKLGKTAWANAMILDPFNLLHYTMTSRNGSHSQTSRSNYRMRALTLNLTYSFGRPPQSNRTNRPDDQQSPQPSQGPDRQVR